MGDSQSGFFGQFDPDFFYRMWGLQKGPIESDDTAGRDNAKSGRSFTDDGAAVEERDRVARRLLEQVFYEEQ